jgi:hypothetical protein
MDEGHASGADPLRQAFVHEAEVALAAGADPRAVGGAVTVALCGHWDHEGPCRWPHNNEIAAGVFRTLFVCGAEEEPHVRSLIRAALCGAAGWQVVADRARPVAADEQDLAGNLLRVPRRVPGT